MSSINFTVQANTPKLFDPKTAPKIFVQFYFPPFSSMKPPVAGAGCMDQSKAFSPRNFETAASKIRASQTQAGRFSYFFAEPGVHGHGWMRKMNEWMNG